VRTRGAAQDPGRGARGAARSAEQSNNISGGTPRSGDWRLRCSAPFCSCRGGAAITSATSSHLDGALMVSSCAPLLELGFLIGIWALVLGIQSGNGRFEVRIWGFLQARVSIFLNPFSSSLYPSSTSTQNPGQTQSCTLLGFYLAERLQLE
jgi:hypothetical protein